jgi:hypothetical protein
VGDEPVQRRDDGSHRAQHLVELQRRRSEQESAKAQVLLQRFVEQAEQAGLATEELTARPWTGRGRYRTGVVGWYLRRDRSVGVGRDGSFYLLIVPPVPFGRWRTVRVDPTPPPLEVGKGARDGEAVALRALLEERLQWPDAGHG